VEKLKCKSICGAATELMSGGKRHGNGKLGIVRRTKEPQCQGSTSRDQYGPVFVYKRGRSLPSTKYGRRSRVQSVNILGPITP
jgi:hypothetical protein